MNNIVPRWAQIVMFNSLYHVLHSKQKLIKIKNTKTHQNQKHNNSSKSKRQKLNKIKETIC